MLYHALSATGDVPYPGHAIVGKYDHLVMAGLTKENLAYQDGEFREGTHFGFMYGGKGIGALYSIPKKTFRITADFDVLVGAEEILSKINELNRNDADINTYLKMAGLAD